MTVYWLSFRIADDAQHHQTYEERYQALIDALRKHAAMFWAETTSFVIFESNSDINTLGSAFKQAIAPQYDLFLMRIMDTKTAVICGKNSDPDIFKLMPYLRAI